MRVHGLKTVFANGENVKFYATYFNWSTYKVKGTKVELIRTDQSNIEWIIESKSHVMFSKIFECVDENLIRKAELSFKFPFQTPSTDESFKMMKISYEIKITAMINKKVGNHEVKIPILIIV